ncbi:hypothetical protein M408DRAFT_268992 [Serendipita vermifera MAFF 305830]|uniref:Uncharacterized protein n=1 Tax=Serendipita vermifera MAFF 305830 TaxID=933852 RepID=A0A0C3AUH6_SERVB|nr:hypothetical protein M408DRAFT_268992 [Serendipita vermifera MAFF 305830]
MDLTQTTCPWSLAEGLVVGVGFTSNGYDPYTRVLALVGIRLCTSQLATNHGLVV